MMYEITLVVKYFILFILLLDFIFSLFFCFKNRLFIFLIFKFILFILSVLVFYNELLLILLLLVNLGLSVLMGFAFQIEYRYFFTKYKLDNLSTMKFLGVSGIGGGVSISKFVDDLVEAVFELSFKKIGALIVIERKVSLDYYISNGYSLISDVSLIVLESIFNENSLLHDGAVIIRDYRIVAAKCFLPMDTSNNIDFWVGARHRAAIGITQNTDAIAIIVSATTGNVSYAIEGKIYYNIDKQKLIEYLQKDLLYNKIDLDKLHRLADKNN